MAGALGLAVAESEAILGKLKHGRDVERVASSTPQPHLVRTSTMSTTQRNQLLTGSNRAVDLFTRI
jgi:hypothetical protein